MEQLIKLTINGEPYEYYVNSNLTLLDFIRYKVGLTGTKRGCDTGSCCACTVLMDGKPVNSCLIFAFEANGKNIQTIEGVAQNGRLHPLQEAFVDEGAVQCGFCTPGMILAAKALLDENPDPTEEEVKQAMVGHLCRCTGYIKIVDAIRAAAGAMRAKQ